MLASHRLLSCSPRGGGAVAAIARMGLCSSAAAQNTPPSAATVGGKPPVSSSPPQPARKAVALPIQLYGLHARYANALYSAASKAGALPKVEQDLATVKTWVDKPQFKAFLRNPVIKRASKKTDLNTWSNGMNEITRGFLGVLAENNRLPDLEKIMATFGKLMNAERGVVMATVTSAEPLEAKQLKAVETEISTTLLSKGQSLKITSKVDPQILGGLQVQVGDKFIDLSIASRIQAVSKSLQLN